MHHAILLPCQPHQEGSAGMGERHYAGLDTPGVRQCAKTRAAIHAGGGHFEGIRDLQEDNDDDDGDDDDGDQ